MKTVRLKARREIVLIHQAHNRVLAEDVIFYKEPQTIGPGAGSYTPKEKYDFMLDEYYEARG